ncbi:PilZ domain-containing protein [Bacillus sp. 1P06AnD]|uniref:PilZ domain-containing protein n=1 Tax=Bacillus sp. 1P06AnD TaxID=3132208 RepID=UPI00399F3DBC
MYKRQEAFRYTFPASISGFLSVINNKDGSERENKGTIDILNISPKGCSFSSGLHLPLKQELQFVIHLKLNEEVLDLPGYVVWKKEKAASNSYGFSFIEKPGLTEQITNEVKRYVKTLRQP